MSIKNSAQPLLEMHDVVKVYSTAAGEFNALKGINMQVGAGEFVGIIGKSGAGKSTLLNMITGVDDITSGEVIVHSNGSSVSIHTMSEDNIALWRGQTLGVVFQSFQLLPMLTLIENITLPMDLCGRFNPKQSRERALELLRLVEIEEHAHKLPIQISGGQQQRVAIARALANDPPILVADEPTGSLDSVTADHIFDVFEHLVSDQGKTIIMVTHDQSLAPRFTRTFGIADGELAHPAIDPEQSVATLAPPAGAGVPGVGSPMPESAGEMEDNSAAARRLQAPSSAPSAGTSQGEGRSKR
jgi:putative ABC transport system ATP-binding protein